MDVARNSTPYWFVDGVSCVGKTSFVRSRDPHHLLMDFDVRSKTNPFFRQKAADHVVQVLYTSSFTLKLMAMLRRMDRAVYDANTTAENGRRDCGTSVNDNTCRSGATNDYGKDIGRTTGRHVEHDDDSIMPLVCDRSPISDIWYELLFKHYDDDARYAQVFDWIEEIDLFAMVPTIFVIPHADHAPRIAQQMAVRNNGIDRMNTDYIVQQIRVFEAVAARFETHRNVRVIRIGVDHKMYSPEYFVWLRKQFIKCISSSTH